MADEEYTFELGSRVALRPGFAPVYKYAWEGSEGWVRKQRVDDDGFEKVFIEWDQKHWRYNAEEDLWTFASHFRLIAPPAPDPEPEPTVEDLLVVEAVAEAEAISDRDAQFKQYFSILHNAAEKASETDNFLLLTFAPSSANPQVIIPYVFMDSIEPEMSLRLMQKVGHMANAALQDLLEEAVARTHDKKEEDGRQAPDIQ